MRRIGFIVNPIAGMGGRVGLKGTDDKVEEARELGAEPRSPARAIEALNALKESTRVSILTCGDPMGESEARKAGFDPDVVYIPNDRKTNAEDTRYAVRKMAESDVQLILFVGGDGTAVDVATIIDELEATIPILGVPAGVKIFSAVFAVTPRAAGRIAGTFDGFEHREVNDIDEAAYREGEVKSELRAVARVPVANEMQSSKQLAGGDVRGLARGVVEDFEPSVTYLLGPGGTLGTVKEVLDIDGSPLGIDVWTDGKLLLKDGNEREILDVLGENNVIIVSPIGGQGFVFGRGNAQLSPEIIKQCGLHVIASPAKLDTIGVLRVDTGDPSLDEELRGWRKVRIGRFEHRMIQIV